MGDSNLTEIKKNYGSQVETYCKSNNILPHKNKCGGFKLENISDLVACSEIKQDEQLEKNLLKSYKLHLYDQKSPSCANISKKENKITSISLKKKRETSGNDYLNNINSRIIMHDTSAKVSAQCPPRTCILDKAISGKQIYKDIIKTKVKSFDTEHCNDLTSVQQFISILELFQEKHRLNNYSGILNKILKRNSTKKCCGASKTVLDKSWQDISKYEITAKQLAIFITQIVITVIPIELFGCFQNREIIIRIACCVIRSARFQPVYLQSYIKKLNIGKMEWLKSFEDKSVKWLVTTKLVKWMLLKYVIKIIYKYIHVTVHPSAVGKRLYFQHCLWHKMKRNFIKKNINSKIFLPVSVKTEWCPPICEYILRMKNSGLRPIAKVRGYNEEMSEMKLSLKFLRQLCATHYGLTSSVEFYDKWKSFVYEKNASKCNKSWLVSCDLEDAYNSILLDQMFSIIKILCKDLPKRLNMKWLASLSKHKDAVIKYDQYFIDLNVVVPVGTMYTLVPDMKNKCECYVSKNALLMSIKMCIFNQKVTVEEQEYLIGKGILQGTMLSNILFDIYYNYISHQRLSTFMKSGTLFRYVDDILYLTESMESAIKFIETIKKGFTEYNCKFKSSKIQTNVPYENNYTNNEIKYIGWKINCDSLETVPYFEEVHPSYLFTVALKNHQQNDSITMLERILYSRSHLRLSRMILNDPTHFVKNLLSLVKKIAVMHAWRALMFIVKLFEDAHSYKENIFEIITTSNKKIVKDLLKHYTQDIQKNVNMSKQEMANKIFELLWTGYKRVFSTDITLQKIFMGLIVLEIRKSNM